ncbi:MAG: CubicO group peptidase (beta-lactamase class C family) [Paraglaciecola sp.]|jgi:CubicO group peptidase (beta-lactamase class C family)
MKLTLVSTLSIALLLSGLTACIKAEETKIASAELSADSDKSAVIPSAQYDEPKGWTKSAQEELSIYTAPENDAYVVVVKILDASGVEQAATKAWKLHNPGFSRALRVNVPKANKGGWDSIKELEYQTSASEEQLALAYVFQSADQWQVVLIDGKLGTMAKRSAAVWGLIESFEIAGYTPENLTEHAANKLSPEKIEALLSFIEESAKTLNIPGVGLSLVQDGKVVFEGGIGVKNILTKEPVSKDTKFMIASNTKGMTTLLLAKLVEMGKLSWDDQVIKHYPDFKLGNEQTTQSVLVKHLVCACTGLPRKDLDWVFNSGPNIPAIVTFNDLANTAPTSGFGELYQYNNQMAAAAGYIAANILYPDMEVGAGYDKAMQEYIFTPLDMMDTTFSFAKAISGDSASPHGLDFAGNTQLIEQTTTDGFNHTVTPYRPAGAAWSTPSDMIKYVQNELSQGIAPNGDRIFALAPLLQRRKPWVATGPNSSYGMGLSNVRIGGIDIVQHGGSMAGYLSNFVAIPSANVGAVILTNSDEGYALLKPFTRRLIEILYDAEPQATDQIAVKAESNHLNAGKLREETDHPGDPAVLANLASLYSSEELGLMSVKQQDGEFILDPGVWHTRVGTKNNADGSTSLVGLAPFLLGMELVVGQENGMRTLSIIDAQHTYRFTEVTEH